MPGLAPPLPQPVVALLFSPFGKTCNLLQSKKYNIPYLYNNEKHS